MIRVAVVSPLPTVRAGLRALLGAAADVEVVQEAGDAQALAQRGPEAADVLVLDWAPGLETPAGPRLATDLPAEGARPLGIVVLGPIPEDERLPAELAGRAWAYLPRESSRAQLIAAVRAVGNDLVVVDPALAGHFFFTGPGNAAPPASGASGEELTGREREVLQLVALGLANKAIARRLGISEHTAKFHVAAILTKLGAGSRTEAVHLATRRGLVVL